ncbi:hypothetical protein FOCG_18481 [Fusarium oxysporum f. sp. radicis-lycopersici 26381]|nr:hypothetical protein FOCG_18481 [Fusarium oxysporum f. sp. radicis-lycopersici 26381]
MLQSESPPSSENDPRHHARSPSPSCSLQNSDEEVLPSITSKSYLAY